MPGLPFLVDKSILYLRQLCSSVCTGTVRYSIWRLTKRKVQSFWSLIFGLTPDYPVLTLSSDAVCVAFTSNDAEILSFTRAELFNFRIVNEFSDLSVLLRQDNIFTVSRPKGLLCGLPVAEFSVCTSSREDVTVLLRHISWFYALLAKIRNMDDGSAVLRMHAFVDNQVGADLVERRTNAAMPAVTLLQSQDEPGQYYCFTLRNNSYEPCFQPYLLILKPEVYEATVSDVGANTLAVGEESLVGADVDNAFCFFLTPGVQEDSGFILLAGMHDASRLSQISGKAGSDYCGWSKTA